MVARMIGSVRQNILEGIKMLHISVWCCVVLFAVINPLSCLVRCAAIEHASHTDLVAVLCRFIPTETRFTVGDAGAAPAPMHAVVARAADALPDPSAEQPRATHESLPLAITVLAVLILSRVVSYRVPAFRVPRTTFPPPAPPPQYAA